MSIETSATGKANHLPSGEGCQERTGQPLESAQRSGGVSGDGMLGKADGVTPGAHETMAVEETRQDRSALRESLQQ